MVNMRYSTILMTAMVVCASGALAQTPHDPSDRLKEVLPASVADRVLAVIARARAHELPTDALENRALKFAAKGVQPDSIEKAIVEHEARMERGKESIERARGEKAGGDEVEAAADVLRKGVDGQAVSALAKSAPSGRSLAVPLYVLGGLLDRGLPSDDALRRVEASLRARASDRELEKMPGEVASSAANGNARGLADAGRPTDHPTRPTSGVGAARGVGAGGPPAGVPANAGVAANPQRGKPTELPGKRP
jgi:hypothetical protein